MSKEQELKNLEEQAQEILVGLKDASAENKAGVDAAQTSIEDMRKEIAELRSKVKHNEMETVDEKLGFLKWFNGVNKGLNEGTPADGGYLVPDEYRWMLLRVAEEASIVRSRATIIPMGSNQMFLPTLASSVVIEWVDEGTAPSADTKPQFGRMTLNAKKMMAYTKITKELIEDEQIDTASLIVTLFGEAIAKEEDRIALMGDVAGASDPFNGAMFAANTEALVMSTAVFTDIDFDLCLDLIHKVKNTERGGAIFVMHEEIYAILRKIQSTATGYIYNAPGSDAPGVLWGYPVITSQHMPDLAASAASTAFVLFGNLKHIYYGDRRMMTMAMSDQADDSFLTDQVITKVTERIAVTAVPLSDTVAKLVTSA